MKLIKLIFKLFWNIDKRYTVIMLVVMSLMLGALIKKDMGFFTLNLVYMYMAFNELRYKYDNKNNFKN